MSHSRRSRTTLAALALLPLLAAPLQAGQKLGTLVLLGLGGAELARGAHGAVTPDLVPRKPEAPAAARKQGSVRNVMARALEVYPADLCPDPWEICPQCPGHRGEEELAADREPIKADWAKFGDRLATSDAAEEHLTGARARARQVDRAFCRPVRQYALDRPRRKETLERQLVDAMYLYNQMELEIRDSLRLLKTFRSRPGAGWVAPSEPGTLTREERAAVAGEALATLLEAKGRVLRARLDKADQRLQGKPVKARAEEEHIGAGK
jgi:hypothetical protein